MSLLLASSAAIMVYTFSAPSAPPSSVRVLVNSSTSISAQWGPVEPCTDQNGPITGYSVRYGTETMSVTGDYSGGMTTISDLTPSTTYSIQVAAENSGLIGPYSTAVNQLTEGMCSESECWYTFISLTQWQFQL